MALQLRAILRRLHAFVPAEFALGATVRSLTRGFATTTTEASGSSSSAPRRVRVPSPPQTFRLDDLRDNDGARKTKRKKGRGVGGGHGLARSAGEGSKGQKSHQGGGIPLGFEGGQSPLWRRTPKFGYMAKVFRREMDVVNLNQLQLWIDQGRVDVSQPISIKTLVDAGLVNQVKHGVKLLGTGADSFTAKVDLTVSQVSQSAIRAVEAAGGRVLSVYMSDLALRASIKPEKFDIPIRSPAPPPRLKRYYVQAKNRGYLSPEVQLIELKRRLASGMPLPLASALHPVFVGGATLDPARHLIDIAVDAPHVVLQAGKELAAPTSP